MEKLVVYQSEEHYAIITLQNGKVNAISHQVIDELNEALDQAEKDQKIVILTGQPGIFSGGFDLKEMQKGWEEAKKLVSRGSQLSLRMLSFPMPIIAACTGHAVAKGSFLLLSSDYRLGTEGDFKIGLNEVAIGMTMHYAGIEIARGRLAPVFLERCVNNAEMFNPKEAITAGFLDKIVPAEHVMPTAIKIAGMMTNLNLKAHKETKLKLRKELLENLAEAIEKDR
ncbi:enoyl-CoA hydratase [Flavobacteriaceae bacterium UJ101]|nr:enoyl-CoA hydratase [Flavobacteriaceae bacterium UJ101]